MPEKDYYKTLGVERNASHEEIHKAYRRLAKKHHPDRNKGSEAAEERFKEVVEAYAVLGDKEKRKAYEHVRAAGMRGGFTGFEDLFRGARGGAARPGFGAQEVRFEDVGGTGDLFGRIFGAGARAHPGAAVRQAGHDVHSQVAVPFETAVTGGRITVRLPRHQPCGRCSGSGAAPGTRTETCPQCGGSGQVRTGFGGFSMLDVCPQCGGRGKFFQRPCAACAGTGTTEQAADVEVKVPAGVEDGQKLRLAGMGEPGAGGAPAGDLILEIRVQSHPTLRREGLNIVSSAALGMAHVALGTTVDVETMDGILSVRVPAGTQPGQRLRLRGRGIKAADGRRGDHLVEVQVQIPKDLTERQKELLRQFAGLKAASMK